MLPPRHGKAGIAGIWDAVLPSTGSAIRSTKSQHSVYGYSHCERLALAAARHHAAATLRVNTQRQLRRSDAAALSRSKPI